MNLIKTKASSSIRSLLYFFYRVVLTKKTGERLYGLLLVASLVLSVTNVFESPLPLGPKTSIGYISLCSIALLPFVLFMYKKQHDKNPTFFNKPIDYAVLLFFLANLVSLLSIPIVYDTILIRMFGSGVLLYFAIRLYPAKVRIKTPLIHALGLFTVIIASVSVLQILFPDVMNLIAEDYFKGKDAYGLDVEYNRGRLFHWGAIILTFPFFYSSIYIIFQKTQRFRMYVYAVVGFVSLALAMVMSNFRWIFLIYAMLTLAFCVFIARARYLSRSTMYKLAMLTIVVFFGGLLLTKAVFDYNLLDRFLLSDYHRDVEESMGRTVLINQAISLFEYSPILGSGPGSYYYLTSAFVHLSKFSIFNQVKMLLVPIAAHNEFFTILSESGILGFCLFVIIGYFTMKKIVLTARKIRTTDKTETLFFVSVALSYISFLLYTMFENIHPQNFVYVIGFSGVVYSWLETRNKASA